MSVGDYKLLFKTIRENKKRFINFNKPFFVERFVAMLFS